MILLVWYDVLEKPLNQKFEKCKDAGSTLYITRLDVVAFIAVRLPQKKAIVRCNETGKTIGKKHWNEETHREARMYGVDTELIVDLELPITIKGFEHWCYNENNDFCFK